MTHPTPLRQVGKGRVGNVRRSCQHLGQLPLERQVLETVKLDGVRVTAVEANRSERASVQQVFVTTGAPREEGFQSSHQDRNLTLPPSNFTDSILTSGHGRPWTNA